MQEPPYKGPETLEFENSFFRVLCLATPDMVRGLQWTLDRSSFSERRYQLFPATLPQITNDKIECEIVLMNVDLGQPVPIENLRKVKGKPGLCAFLQPTPQQLLTLGELPHWTPVAWDGVNFEKLAQRLDEIAARYEREILTQHFLETCRVWSGRVEELPDVVEWLNPPEDWTGPRVFALDSGAALLTVGAPATNCDIRLPILAEAKISEAGEFRYINNTWSFRAFSDKLGVSIRGNKDRLKPGDEVVILGVSLHLKKSPRVEEFLRMARRMGVVDEVLAPQIRESADKTLGDVCLELIHSGVKGELRLNSGLRNGSIYFEDGTVYFAVTGSVSGAKALMRMMSWEAPTWRFNVDRAPVPDRRSFRFSFLEFTRMYTTWKKGWARVKAFVPPPTLKVKANPGVYLSKSQWSQIEFQVIASVCEYPMIRDILNSCPLSDVEIFETLIQMRKQGLLEPLGRG